MFSETTVLTNFVVSPLELLNQAWFTWHLIFEGGESFITDFIQTGVLVPIGLSQNRT